MGPPTHINHQPISTINHNHQPYTPLPQTRHDNSTPLAVVSATLSRSRLFDTPHAHIKFTPRRASALLWPSPPLTVTHSTYPHTVDRTLFFPRSPPPPSHCMTERVHTRCVASLFCSFPTTYLSCIHNPHCPTLHVCFLTELGWRLLRCIKPLPRPLTWRYFIHRSRRLLAHAL